MIIDSATLKKVQQIQLAIMKEIHSLCETNGLRYIMLSGTFLGAVRHKGFIPWDDDLDIGLLRPDYEKLIGLLKENPLKGCFLQTFDTDEHYVQPYAKVRAQETKYVESYWKDIDMHHGIFIDIFPLDKIDYPGSIFTEFRRLIIKEITFSIWRKEKCHLVRKGIKKVEEAISYPIGFFFSKRTLIDLQNRMAIRENKKWSYVSSMFTSNYNTKKVFYNLADFNNLRLYDFEDCQLYGPPNYDEILSRLFGNYMELPPENKRISGHDVIEVSLMNSEIA